MQIIILNSDTDKTNLQFDYFLSVVQRTLYRIGHYVKILNIRDMMVDDCLECHYCLQKQTCILHDDTRFIQREVRDADLVIWASPLVNGSFPALMLKTLNRLLKLMHSIAAKELKGTHPGIHSSHFPAFGAIVEMAPYGNPEEMLINRLTLERVALTTGSMLKFFITTETKPHAAIVKMLPHLPVEITARLEFEDTAESFAHAEKNNRQTTNEETGTETVCLYN